MRISNETGDTIVIEDGEHVDARVDFIQKRGGRIVEVIVEEQR